jgi:hypothetical protein
LHLYNPGDLVKIGEEIYLVVSHDRINHDFTIRGISVVWFTTLLDMKGHFFEIDSELLARSAELVSRGKNE